LVASEPTAANSNDRREPWAEVTLFTPEVIEKVDSLNSGDEWRIGIVPERVFT
jgi:hypothetical protein